jgi:hypothetical protein
MASVRKVRITPAVMASGTHRDMTFANLSSPLSGDCGATAPPQLCVPSIIPRAGPLAGARRATRDGRLSRHPRVPGPGSGGTAKGDPQQCPQCGSSEIKIGDLGRRQFIAAIKPWHGNRAVVYTEKGRAWKRHVIEDAMINGHAFAVDDLNGDGRDEIVAGFRGKRFQLYIFTADDETGRRWTRHILDPGGIAAANCKIADFHGDGLSRQASLFYFRLTSASKRGSNNPNDFEAHSGNAPGCARPRTDQI